MPEIIIQPRCLCYVCSKMMKIVFLSGYIIRFINISNHDRGTWRVSIHNIKLLEWIYVSHLKQFHLNQYNGFSFIQVPSIPIQICTNYKSIIIYNLNVLWMNLHIFLLHFLFFSIHWMNGRRSHKRNHMCTLHMLKKKKKFMMKWNEWKHSIIEKLSTIDSIQFYFCFQFQLKIIYFLDTPHLKFAFWIEDMSIYIYKYKVAKQTTNTCT